MEESPLNLMIKTVNNDTYNISVTNSTSIHNLKETIKESTAIDIDRQRLIYRGKVLTDESHIRDYNIEDGHTVHMVARPANFREMQESANSTPEQPINRNRLAFLSTPQQQRAALFSSLTREEITPTPVVATPSSVTNDVNNNVSTSAAASNAAAPATTNNNNPLNDPNSLEHIRQGLLTMHTLISTVTSMNNNNNGSIRETKEESGILAESKPSGTSSLPPPPSSSSSSSVMDNTTLTNERKFHIGQWLDVKDTVSQWLEATVMNTDETGQRLFVHYNGWPQRWDEWISYDSPRIAPFRSRTNHSSLNTNLSPAPNISVAHAPSTGINDIRTIMPEIANMFRVLQPMVEELSLLSQESLRYSEAVNQENISTSNRRIAPGMPWDSYITRSTASENKTDDGIPPLEDAVDANNPESLAVSEKFMDMDMPDVKESSQAFSSSKNKRDNKSEISLKYKNQQEVDERLRLVTRDVCPLFDRFGRLLADTSPHLWSTAMPGVNRPTPANRFDPFQSLESRLLSLLRERPPSPSPVQAYRAPITSSAPRIEPLDMLRSGLLRAGTLTEDNEPTTSAEATASATRSNNPTNVNTPVPGNANNNPSNSVSERGSGRREHHVDIHIAILSPPSSSRPPVDSLSRTVANLTASLQAQAQQLAARTQELSERTSAVSEITSAITEAIRNSVNSSNANDSNVNANNDNNNNNNSNISSSSAETVESNIPELSQEGERLELDFEVGEPEEIEEDDHSPNLPRLLAVNDRDTSGGDLDDLNLDHQHDHTSTLMPSENAQNELLPFYNVSNQRIVNNYGTVENNTPNNLNGNEEETPVSRSAEPMSPSDDNNDANHEAEEGDQRPRSFLQRLRRSFFSSPR